MNRISIVLVSVLALAACGGGDESATEAEPDHAEAPAAPEPATAEAPTGPAPVEGYDWSFQGPTAEDPDRAALSYAVPETDDVPLMFDCQRESGRVMANTDSAVSGVGAIILGSGDAQSMYLVTSRTPSELSGGELLMVEIPASDAPLQAFQDSGWINLSVAGVARDLAAHPGAGRTAIEQFFSFCAPAPASGPTAD